MNTRIKFLKKPKLRKPVIFTGLPGIGLVGKIAIEYLVSQLKCVKIAEIYSDSFPPSIVTKKGLAELIYDEIYWFKGKGRDFLFLAGPVQPPLDFRIAGSAEHYEFSRTLVEAFKKMKITKIITVAGIDIGEDRISKEPKIVVIGTDKKILNEFKKDSVLLGSEGLVTGAAGLLIGMGAEQGIEGVCLMGQTSSRLVLADHQSAQKIVELLAKKFNFKVNVKEIEAEAKKVEKAFSSLQEQLHAQREEKEKPGEEEFKKYTR